MQICDIYTGNSISESIKVKKYSNVKGMPYIGTKDVSFDHDINYKNGVNIPTPKEDSFKIAEEKTILMCIEGGSAGRKIAITNRQVCFGNKLCCFSPYTSISEYLYYYLQAPVFLELFHSSKVGIIGGVSVNNIKQMIIAIPPIGEIYRIVDKLKIVNFKQKDI